MPNQTKRPRDYKAEYRRRVERALAKGHSLSQARGHPRAGERAQSGPTPVDRTSSLEHALKLMKGGASQRQAAKASSLPVERLRRFLKENTDARRQGRTWIIVDQRPVRVVMASRGQVREVSLPYDTVSDVGRYWVAVNRFLETNSPSYLAPYVGKGVRDSGGKFHEFECGPNVLRKLEHVGELAFVDIYRQTVT